MNLSREISRWRSTSIGKTLVSSNYISNVITDARELYVRANRFFIEFTGFELAEIQGLMPFSLLQGTGTDPFAVARIQTAFDSGSAARETILNYRRTGEKFWNRIDLDPIFNNRAKLLGFFMIGFDLRCSESPSGSPLQLDVKR